MVAGVSSHFELESFFRTLFRTAVFALTFEAECSVRNNSQVCWDVFKIFTGPRDVQLSAVFYVSVLEYACLCHLWVGT